MSSELKAPFPWFGGKRTIADLVWQRLGDVDNYVEPFAGSVAVLLRRPHPPRVETLNDWDCMVANFWRATQHDPEAVAEHADGPVNEADLHARHRWLVLSEHAADFRQKMRTDPNHFDARVAGWWCWGLCMWIGSGWCQDPELEADGALAGKDLQSKIRIASHNRGSVGKGIHARGEAADDTGGSAEWDKRPVLDSGRGVDPAPGQSQQIPHMDASGRGEHRDLSQKVPDLGSNRTSRFARGIHGSHENASLPDGRRPTVADDRSLGRGVHASGPEALHEKRPFVTGFEGQLGRGVDASANHGTCAARRAWLLDWFGRLRDRLRLVRVCCGDWSRVCASESTTTRLGLTGVFLDPPYPRQNSKGKRAGKLYASDSAQKTPEALRDEVLAWCRERGGDRRMRIVVAGYQGDGYEALVADHGWTEEEWTSGGGYGNRTETGKANAKRERLWSSPGCLSDPQRGLFDHLETPPLPGVED